MNDAKSIAAIAARLTDRQKLALRRMKPGRNYEVDRFHRATLKALIAKELVRGGILMVWLDPILGGDVREFLLCKEKRECLKLKE